MSNIIEWLHISDLHFGYNDNAVEQMREVLPLKAKEYFKGKKVDYIFITGDIIFGKAEHKTAYSEAKAYIENLRKELNVQNENIFIVPGNHDYKRSEPREAIISQIRKKYEADIGIINSDLLDILKSDYNEYKNFYEGVCGRPFTSEHLLVNAQVNILALNSSLMSFDSKHDKGNLLLGMEIIDRELKKVSADKPIIVLSHHDFEWFNKSEREKLELHLKRKNAVVFLCGHVHKCSYNLIASMEPEKYLHECLCSTNMDLDENNNPSDMGFMVGKYDIDKKIGESIEFWWEKRFEKFINRTSWPFSPDPSIRLNAYSSANDNVMKKTIHPTEPSEKYPASLNLGNSLLNTYKPKEKKASSIMSVDGNVCMIIGGAGFVGEELCRHVIENKASKLIIVDTNLNALYELENEFQYIYEIEIMVEIVSICDYVGLENIFRRYKPNIIIHCAFYKHIGYIEKNIREAVINNILGTHNLLLLSQKYDTEKFIYISSDKAVHPTSLMGKTKVIGELLTIYFNNMSEKTQCYCVRFGNLMGPKDNLISHLERQIDQYKRVRLVHPDIIRYFMTSADAADLTLETIKISKGSEIFVLDMGEPIRITDLTKELIKNKGLRLDRDVKIEYTGLRPGEKLYEELLLDEEGVLATANNRIFLKQRIEQERLIKFSVLYNKLVAALKKGDTKVADIIDEICTI